MSGSDRAADRSGAADGDESGNGTGDEDDSSSRATCPSCGEGVLLVTGVGPTEHYASPCGCRIDPRRV